MASEGFTSRGMSKHVNMGIAAESGNEYRERPLLRFFFLEKWWLGFPRIKKKMAEKHSSIAGSYTKA